MGAEDGFWETLHLLIEWKKTGRDAKDDVDDWVNKVVTRNGDRTDSFEDNSTITIRSETESLVSKEQEVRKFMESVNLPPIECKYVFHA